MKIALASLDQKWEDKFENLKRCLELTASAKAMGAELIIFPEMTLTGFSMNINCTAEDPEQSDSAKAFSELAMSNQIAVIAGVVFQLSEKVGNALLVFSKDGKEQARYFKIHPFSLANEDQFFQSGKSLAKWTSSEFKFGFSICYDLRFPELYSAMAKDCEVLVNIANWPKQRVDHWLTLLKARAIENQVFVIGVNRVGIDANGLEYEYSSLIVNANGEFLQPLISEAEIDVYEITQKDLSDFRKSFSTRQDRRCEIYRDLI